MTEVTRASIEAVLRASTSDAAHTSGVTPERAASFQAALGRATDSSGPGAPTQPGAGTEAPATVASSEVDARERARRALELGAGDAARPGGDLILDGLQRLRSTFDVGQSRVADIVQNKELDSRALLSLQMEIVNYTLLVDVTSKLTGKSTQSMDTLMKGQ